MKGRDFLMATKLDSEKKELTFGINNFNNPEEVTGVAAWTKVITNLLFMKKGSIPTDPEMGCEIQKYEYAFIDDVKDQIEAEITTQVQKYLSDVPFSGVTVSSEIPETGGPPILLIVLSFSYDNGELQTSVIAAENSSNLLNFEVVI